MARHRPTTEDPENQDPGGLRLRPAPPSKTPGAASHGTRPSSAREQTAAGSERTASDRSHRIGPVYPYKRPTMGLAFLNFLALLGSATTSFILLPASLSLDIVMLHTFFWVIFFVCLCNVVLFVTQENGFDLNAPLSWSAETRWSYILTTVRASIFSISTLSAAGWLFVVRVGWREDSGDSAESRHRYRYFWNAVSHRFPRDPEYERCEKVAPADSIWGLFGVPCVLAEENRQTVFSLQDLAAAGKLNEAKNFFGGSSMLWFPTRAISGEFSLYDTFFHSNKLYLNTGDVTNLSHHAAPITNDVLFLNRITVCFFAAFMGMMLSDLVNYRGIPSIIGDPTLIAHHLVCILPAFQALSSNTKCMIALVLHFAVAELGTFCYGVVALDTTSKLRRQMFRYGMTVSNALMMATWLWMCSVQVYEVIGGVVLGTICISPLVCIRQATMLRCNKLWEEAAGEGSRAPTKEKKKNPKEEGRRE